MANLLTIGCCECGRQLKMFQPLLVERLSRGHGCHFCGGDLDVPDAVLAEVGRRAEEAPDVPPPERGRCLACTRGVKPRPSDRETWSCYMCGATMLPPATDGGICKAGPKPDEKAASWGEITLIASRLGGLEPWAMRIRTMLVQRAHRGEVSLREAQELVDETLALAHWKPTGTRQLIPLTITTLADLLPAAMCFVWTRAVIGGDGPRQRLNIGIPDIAESDPCLPLPGKATWGPKVASIHIDNDAVSKPFVGDVGAIVGMVGLGLMDDTFPGGTLGADVRENQSPPSFPAVVHISGELRDGGWALRPGLEILHYDEGKVAEFPAVAATRFYAQLGRLKPLAERYMKLRALFGPLLRPSALYITRAAVEARLDALGLPPAAAPEFVVEARRNAAAFKQLVGL